MGTVSGRRPRSLRRRLVVGVTFAAAIAAFAEALLLHIVWYGYEERLIDRIVVDQLVRSLDIHAIDPTLAYPNTNELRLYVVSRAPGEASDALPPYLRPLVDASQGDETRVEEVRGWRGIDYHVGIAHRGTRTFLLAYDTREHQKRRLVLLAMLLGIAVAVTLIGAWLALGFVDRLLGGLNRLQRMIADDREEERFRLVGMDVEIEALAEALDRHRLQVAASLRKERAFAAAASHELRTPLTRIGTSAEVMLAQPELPPRFAPRLQSIREAVGELQRMLDVLLQVARWRAGSGAGNAVAPGETARPLSSVVSLCVDRLASESRLLGAPVEVDLDGDGPVSHPSMLEVVLANLLRNAIRHGRGAPVRVTGDSRGVEIADAGPGIEAAALDRVFDPFWRGSAAEEEKGPSGLGLGLTIAERVCAAAGWTLSIDSAPGRGTRARVRWATAGSA
jgi:signal transduction histidine kinase